MEQASAHYGSYPVNTYGDRAYSNEAAVCGHCLFRIFGHKGFSDHQSEALTGQRNQDVRHDYKSFFKRKNNEYK